MVCVYDYCSRNEYLPAFQVYIAPMYLISLQAGAPALERFICSPDSLKLTLQYNIII